jgi:hypothetical protein
MSGCYFCRHAEPAFDEPSETGAMIVDCSAKGAKVPEVESDCKLFSEHSELLQIINTITREQVTT